MIQKVFLTLLCFAIAGCASLPHPVSTQPVVPIQSIVYASLPPPNWSSDIDPAIISTHQLFLSLSQSTTDHDWAAIQDFLKTPDQDISELSRQERTILMTQLLLAKGRPREAFTTIRPVIYTASHLPPDTFMILEMVLMETYQRTDQIERSIATEIALNSLMKQYPLSTDIWQKLLKLNSQQLNQLLNVTRDSLHLGWYALALLSKQDSVDHISFTSSINQWKSQYPNHPARSILPSDSALEQFNHTPLPMHIALLLPQKGDFAKESEAIHDGFMAAFYVDQTRRNILVDARVYNTSETDDITQLYQQAINDGAQMIIGPLAQQDIDAINQKMHGFSVPTFVLGKPSHQPSSPLLIPFGLPENDSAEQAADLAWQKGCSRLLVVVPNNPWGQTMEQAFTARWNALGATVIDTLHYPTDQPLSKTMATFLRIDQSQQRSKQLEERLNEGVKSVTRRRQDFDGVFLAAPPEDARQIKPLLRFYFAGNNPTFSTFSAYTGVTSPNDDKDLNDVYLNDFSWFSSNDLTVNNLKKTLQSLWPTHYRNYSRWLAIGADSYWLCMEYAHLILLPPFPIHGTTGDLSIDARGYIKTILTDMRFRAGLINRI